MEAANGVPLFALAKLETRVQFPVLELNAALDRYPSLFCQNSHIEWYPSDPEVLHPVTETDAMCGVATGDSASLPPLAGAVGVGVEPAGISVTEGCGPECPGLTNVPSTAPRMMARTINATTIATSHIIVRPWRALSDSVGVTAPDLPFDLWLLARSIPDVSFASASFSMTDLLLS